MLDYIQFNEHRHFGMDLLSNFLIIGVGTIEHIRLVEPSMYRPYERVQSRNALFRPARTFFSDTARFLLHQLKNKLRTRDGAFVRAILHLVFHRDRHVNVTLTAPSFLLI